MNNPVAYVGVSRIVLQKIIDRCVPRTLGGSSVIQYVQYKKGCVTKGILLLLCSSSLCCTTVAYISSLCCTTVACVALQ